MKNINPLGLFDDHFLLEKLTKPGDRFVQGPHYSPCEITASLFHRAIPN